MAVSATSLTNVLSQSRRGGTRFVILGGFLGAGKTTLAARFGAYLKACARRGAYITNDHGTEALDAQILGQSFPTVQITGGSYSAQFDALTAATAQLTEAHRPEVIVAECVGGAADFAATVASPLSRLHRDEFTVAPYSVLVDALLATRMLDHGTAFSEKILYIYRKQIEEAEFVVINKIDLLSKGELMAIKDRLMREFAGKKFFEISARTGAGFETWCEAVLDGEFSAKAGEIDMDLHMAGQASLGSLNCTVQVSALKGFQCNPVLLELAKAIQRSLMAAHVPLAHLKMTLMADFDVEGIATLNLAHGAEGPEVGPELSEPVSRGKLSVSLRAECKPDLLNAVVTDALTHVCAVFPGLFARLEHIEHFRPSGVAPTHRMV
jgi:Ni2+-binding GTPase involved in maturation of urease and hydrogenase